MTRDAANRDIPFGLVVRTCGSASPRVHDYLSEQDAGGGRPTPDGLLEFPFLVLDEDDVLNLAQEVRWSVP